MSLYALPGSQVWRQSPIDPTSTSEVVGYSACNQYGILGLEGDPSEQEDLVARFAKQMTMATQTPGVSSQAPPIVYSITQHYHHSSHVARGETPDGASREQLPMPTDTTNLDGILMSHNVDPLSLSSTQRRLFEYAMPDQRSRLLQMWQICPADSSLSDAETKERCYAQSLANRGIQPTSNQTMQSSHLHDVEMCEQLPHENDNDGQSYAEPYMISGYDDISQKDRELSAHTAMSLMIEPTTGAPYRRKRSCLWYWEVSGSMNEKWVIHVWDLSGIIICLSCNSDRGGFRSALNVILDLVIENTGGRPKRSSKPCSSN